jgi:hypothetical protein
MVSASCSGVFKTGPELPAERVVGKDPAIRRVAIHQFRTLDDGTVVAMFESVGDAERGAELLDAGESVLPFDIATTDCERYSTHCHVEVGDSVARVFGIAGRHELVLDLPMRYADHGGRRVGRTGPVDSDR